MMKKDWLILLTLQEKKIRKQKTHVNSIDKKTKKVTDVHTLAINQFVLLS